MISIKQALYNVLHSRYGRDVRQSIHDAIYQIDEKAICFVGDIREAFGEGFTKYSM